MLLQKLRTSYGDLFLFSCQFFESSFPSESLMSIQKATLGVTEQLHNPLNLMKWFSKMYPGVGNFDFKSYLQYL